MRKCKYQVNHNYFSEMSDESVYWAGFIAADGSLSDKENRLTIELSTRDINHLEKFKKHICHTGPISTRIKKGTEFSYSRVRICSRKILNDLMQIYNITPNKSKILKPPENLTLEQSLLYIWGYLDGNGSLLVDSRKRARLTFVGSQAILEWIKSILILIFNDFYKNSIYKFSSIYMYQIENKRIKNIIDTIIKTGYINLGLERKTGYNKLHEIKNYCI